MAARGAIIAFAASILALASPATAQVGGANVAAQQQTIDEIEAELAGLEAAARWDGDPCAKIHRGASKLDSRFAFSVWADHASPPGEFSSFPPEMVRGWRARVARLLKICPDETGFIGDPHIAERPLTGQQTNTQPATPGATTFPNWVNAEPPLDPATVDPGKFRAAEIAYINRRLAELEAMPADRCAEVQRAAYHLLAQYIQPPYLKAYYPAALLDSWKERVQRLLVICEELQPPPQASSFWPYSGYVSEPTQGSGAVEAGKRAVESPKLNPLDIFGGGAQQQAPSDAGNPIREGLNILGGGNRQAEQDRGAQNPREQQAAPEGSKRQRSKARPRRDRQGDRCDRSKGQVPADCPNR